MALVIYRLGTFVPIPGVDMDVFQQAFSQNQQGLLGRFNMFAGGAVERMAVFALNVMPYISASIIMTLMNGSIPSLMELDKEGEQGRKQINQYTRYLTVFLAAFQAFGIAKALEASLMTMATLFGTIPPQVVQSFFAMRDLEAGARKFRRFGAGEDRKSTRLNSSHTVISYAVFCL